MSEQLLVHVADEPDGLFQRCRRCGQVLIDRTDEATIASTGSAPRWWTGNVAIGDGCQSATIDPPTCTPPPPLSGFELGAVERAAAAAAGPFGGLVGRLVAEVRRLRSRLHYHHVSQGTPSETDRALEHLQNAMDRYGLTVDQVRDPEKLRAKFTERCRFCAEFDGALPTKDVH